jgi:shikimate dehydrogenase
MPKKLAVIGDPIAHSLSPILQNYLIRHFALPFTYEALQVRPAELPDFMKRVRSGEFRGVNVTIPHKQAVTPFLDGMEEDAARIGAVNTIVVEGTKLIGHNTDARGFLQSLDDAKVPVAGRDAFVLGAGGAAQAVVYALLCEGARRVFICNRNQARASELIAAFAQVADDEQLQYIPWSGRMAWLRRNPVDLIINATSIGMHSHSDDTPLPQSVFIPGMAAVDLVYNPLHTAFLLMAKPAGAITVHGLGMLIYQGVAALEIWSKRHLEVYDIYSSLEKELMEALNRQGDKNDKKPIDQ